MLDLIIFRFFTKGISKRKNGCRADRIHKNLVAHGGYFQNFIDEKIIDKIIPEYIRLQVVEYLAGDDQVCPLVDQPNLFRRLLGRH